MRILLRNWHLKLGAIALATILYTGFVYSGSFSEESFSYPAVRAINQPTGSYLLTQQLPGVEIHYRLAADAERVTDKSFSVTVDLGDYDMGRTTQLQALSVDVEPLQAGLSDIRFSPSIVPVSIDQLVTRSDIPIVVERGAVPDGLEIGIPRYSPRTATASGPKSQLDRVDHAVARVVIQESGIDISEQLIDLVPVDIDGARVDAVELDPPAVSVSIDVQTVETTKTVAVRPVVTGSPAAGYEVGNVSVIPAVVTLRGTPDILADITEVRTAGVSVVGATETQTATPELILPADTQLASGQDSTPSVSVQVRASIVTRTFLLGIICQGAPVGSACLPQLTQLSVTLEGPAATLSDLTAGALTPIVDVSGLAPGTHDVPASIVLPDGVELVSISPGIVSVIIEPPATPTPAPA